MKRFITEYANYQKKSIINNELMEKGYKKYGLSRIDKILERTKRGFITTDEAMNLISNIFNDSDTEYKRLVCELAEIPIEKTVLKMI